MPHRAERERAMRGCVKLLGGLVGETVRAQEGDAAYAALEALRQGFVALRRHAKPDTKAIAKLAAGLADIEVRPPRQSACGPCCPISP